MSAYFPATYSTLSARALAGYLATQYALDDVVELNFINRGLNDTYLVRYGADEKCILRVYRSNWRSTNDIAYEIDALAHCATRMSQSRQRCDAVMGTICAHLTRRRGRDTQCSLILPPERRCPTTREGIFWRLDMAGASRKFTMRWKHFRRRTNAPLLISITSLTLPFDTSNR